MEYETALAALKKAKPILTAEEHDELENLIGMFEPYKGDDPDEARARHNIIAKCQNCAFEIPTLFHPAELGKTAKASIRLAQCPRCFATDVVI